MPWSPAYLYQVNDLVFSSMYNCFVFIFNFLINSVFFLLLFLNVYRCFACEQHVCASCPENQRRELDPLELEL